MWRLFYRYEVAAPCATENEVNREEAAALIANGCIGISEEANMPSEAGAIDNYHAVPILSQMLVQHFAWQKLLIGVHGPLFFGSTK